MDNMLHKVEARASDGTVHMVMLDHYPRKSRDHGGYIVLFTATEVDVVMHWSHQHDEWKFVVVGMHER
jgi:hypothetical protein